MGLLSRILTGYDRDGVSRQSREEARAAEARRQECEQALHDPRLEDRPPPRPGTASREVA